MLGSRLPVARPRDGRRLFVSTGNRGLSRHGSWGYFDPGEGAGGVDAHGDYLNGYQLVPVNWGINTERKRAFFDLVREVTRS